MTSDQALDILERIAAAYIRFELTERRIELWIDHLIKMPYKKVATNVDRHIREKPFPPTISEIAASEITTNDFLKQYNEWKKEGEKRIAGS